MKLPDFPTKSGPSMSEFGYGKLLDKFNVYKGCGPYTVGMLYESAFFYFDPCLEGPLIFSIPDGKQQLINHYTLLELQEHLKNDLGIMNTDLYELGSRVDQTFVSSFATMLNDDIGCKFIHVPKLYNRGEDLFKVGYAFLRGLNIHDWIDEDFLQLNTKDLYKR